MSISSISPSDEIGGQIWSVIFVGYGMYPGRGPIHKPKGILSLQKHFHRSEHWVVTQGSPKITLNKKNFFRKPFDTIFIAKGAIHRIQNPNKKPVKIGLKAPNAVASIRGTEWIYEQDEDGKLFRRNSRFYTKHN